MSQGAVAPCLCHNVTYMIPLYFLKAFKHFWFCLKKKIIQNLPGQEFISSDYFINPFFMGRQSTFRKDQEDIMQRENSLPA